MYQLVTIIVVLGFVAADINSRRMLPLGEPQDGLPLISRGEETSPSTVPWHAGIYEINGPLYKQLCGGTLVAPDLVVTAAHCLWDFYAKRPISTPERYKVTLGKIYREWHLDTDNPFVQRMNVQTITLYNRFEGFLNNQLPYDIALLKLTNNATMSDFVQIAALDQTPGPPANGSVGVVSIFKRLLTFDKFCAGYSNWGKSVCQGDSGGGFVVTDIATNMSTLRGIVSMDFRPREVPRSICYDLHYTGFTNVGEKLYLEWIETHRSEGARLCAAVKNSVSVAVKYCIKNFVDVDCKKPMSAGTNAVFLCKKYYRFADNRTSMHVTCLRDGSWSKPPVNCVPSELQQEPDCGLQSTLRTVIHGELVDVGQLPWQVLVYEGSDYYCSGTLIAPKHVITSASCVSVFSNTSVLQLVAGKQYRNISLVEPDQQKRGVKAIIPHHQYENSQVTVVHDIALLVASHSFQKTSTVFMACVKWSSHLPQLTSSDHLIVGAWRRETNQRGSNYVSDVQNFTIVPTLVCNETARQNERKSLNSHMFCAHPINHDTCDDSYGAGLLVLNDTSRGARYFLTGVRSNWLQFKKSGSCWINRLAAFTNVTEHIGWIKQHVLPHA